MTTQEIANRLHKLVVQGDSKTAYDELFSDDAVAIKPKFPGFERVEGLENIRKKGETMVGAIESINSRIVSDAILVGTNHIALNIAMDATLKDGNRMAFSEIALYEVKDEKIISEQFFY